MKIGKQSDLTRYLDKEYGIIVSRQAISQAIKAKDYRFKFTPEGKLIIDETAKILADSGFGKRARYIRAAKGHNSQPYQRKTEPAKDTSSKQKPDKPAKEIGELAERRARLELEKVQQQVEDIRIKNERALKTLVNFNETADIVFNFLRPLRDDLLDVAKRVSALANMASTKAEATKIINDEINRILKSRVGSDYIFDDQLKKKIIQILRL